MQVYQKKITLNEIINIINSNAVSILPNTVYVDEIEGTELGQFGNIYKPFNNIENVFNSLPIDDGMPIFIIFLSDLTINTVIPNRILYFLSETNNILKIDYSGNVYNNTGGVYNELHFLNRYGSIIFSDGCFLAEKTKIIIDCDIFSQDPSLTCSECFTTCEELQFSANSSFFPRAGLATILNTGVSSSQSRIKTGNLIYTPFNSIVILSSNFPSSLDLGFCKFDGSQTVSLCSGSVDLILNNDLLHIGTGFINLVVTSGLSNITFNNINNLKRVRIPVFSAYSKIVLTGFIDNWENETLYPFYQTNQFDIDGITQSSVEFRSLTVLNFTSSQTFFYAHSNTQASLYERFKFICVDSHLKLSNRFLSLSNRSKNFELTNNIIEDIGDLTDASIIRGDGLSTDINIISLKPNYINQVVDSTIVFLGTLNSY